MRPDEMLISEKTVENLKHVFLMPRLYHDVEGRLFLAMVSLTGLAII